MNPKLLALLACPRCKGPLEHDRKAGQLLCRAESLAYPVEDGIAMLLPALGRPIDPPVTS
ncbi:MAG: Trm112 family protein [Pseudomonadota bacterium]|jgi:hypothetical protein